MANENNKINELVSDDDDPTAELEAVTFRQDQPQHARLYESGDDTFDVAEQRSGDAQTISKLRYDIEQLRAKWLGREAEIRARKEITDALNAELANAQESLARKEKLLKTRDRRIKSLKSEIRERDEKYRGDIAALEAQLKDFLAGDRELPGEP